MKHFSILLLLSILSTSVTYGQDDSTTNTFLTIGLTGGYGGSSGVLSYGSEIGVLIEHANRQATVVSLEGGIFDTRIPINDYEQYYFPILLDSSATRREYQRRSESHVGLNVGHFLSNGFGLVVNGGLIFSPKVTLEKQFSTHYQYAQRTLLKGAYGFELRYLAGSRIQIRSGYHAHRGITLGYTSPLSFTVDSAKLMADTPSYRRIFVTGGYGIHKGIIGSVTVHNSSNAAVSSVGYDPRLQSWAIGSSLMFLTQDARNGRGVYYSFGLMMTDAFDNDRKYSHMGTLNLGWLWRDDLLLDVSVGAGLSLDAIESATGERLRKGRFILNAEANVGFSLWEKRDR